ncbi:unnamed protein product [Linum tenue]|uniref:Uncharacterized protein n=1 Tax=Linum tenue TaxID=586396 RepID=A0AAV0P9U2_9ROSI|nr:unnamed protein product [Linum tenue]
MQVAAEGIYRGFGTSAIGSLPGRALALTSLEVSKDVTLKYLEKFDMPEATRLGIANGVAGMVSNLVSCGYYVPLDVMDNYGGGRPSVMKTVKNLVEEDGWWGFYRGVGPRFVNMSLCGTTMIVTYELIKRLSVKQQN